MIPIRFQNCTLGIFGLKSWEPPRSLRTQVQATNSSRNNASMGSCDYNRAHVGAGHDQGNSGGQWPNPVSSVFMPKTDVTMVEGREAGQKASSGQSARLSGQWPADESRQMTASGNVQPTGMRREWSPGEDRLPSDTSRQWSAPGNAQPVSANRQWSANENRQCSAPENAHLASASRQWSAPGSAQPANESRQWSAPENAQPANEGRQWSAPENAHPVSTNRQWSAPGNAQLANENRQRSAPIGGQSNHTSDQWHVKENGPSTHETRQWSARDRDYSSSGDQQGRREDRENGFGPQGNPHHSDPYNSTQEPGRSRAQLSNHGPSVVAPKVEPAAASRGGYRLIAKHNYTVNPNSPLGPGAELGFKQAEQLTKIGVHPEQELWWRAKNENGDVGYVPSTYMMVLEDSGTLPWLKNRVVEEEEPAIAKPLEPYRSAYNKSGPATTVAPKYYCEICERSFNGPQPFSAHMVSKVHRETVEARREESC